MNNSAKKTLVFVKFRGCNYDQNVTQMFDYICTNHEAEFDIVLYDEKSAEDLSNDIKVFNNRSNEFLALCQKATFIFCSFYQDIEYFLKYTNENTQIINVWHGMPIKNICKLYFRERLHCWRLLYSKKRKYVHHIVTSKLYQQVFCAAFNTKPEHVHVLGQVRNNIVLNQNSQARSFIKNITDNKFKKTILYCPTHTARSKDANKLSGLFDFTDYELTQLNEFLKEQNILFLFKRHEIDHTNYNIDSSITNIKDVRNSELSSCNITTEHLLHSVDLLITDSSSLYIDYLLLDKPIIFSKSNTKHKDKRGFILDYAYEVLCPGPNVNTQKDLIAQIAQQITLDSFKSERQAILNLVHYYPDSNSAERIYTKFLKD
jgi:CDP-glycerol glycerophosphotransferase (TagB/SpsB family)